MLRKTFLEKLALFGGLSLLPNKAFTHYKKLYLLQCFVAGFRYYKGMELLEHMREGDLLRLVREPQNKFDKSAIALYWNSEKIGFVPASENEMLSRLLDANALEMIAEITHLNRKTMPWENVSIAVYFLKQLPIGEVAPEMEYLTVLHNPSYNTYKRNDDVISTFPILQNSEENDNDWYNFLVKNSTSDSIYSIIHHSDVKPDYTYGKDTGDYFLINTKHHSGINPLKQIANEVDTSIGLLDNLFDKEGYITVSTEDIESLVPAISRIVNTTDKLGRHYIELLF